MKAYENPDHHGNSEKHFTGKICIEKGCDDPAGTVWSAFWCQSCNADRMNKISKNFEDLLKGFNED